MIDLILQHHQFNQRTLSMFNIPKPQKGSSDGKWFIGLSYDTSWLSESITAIYELRLNESRKNWWSFVLMTIFQRCNDLWIFSLMFQPKNTHTLTKSNNIKKEGLYTIFLWENDPLRQHKKEYIFELLMTWESKRVNLCFTINKSISAWPSFMATHELTQHYLLRHFQSLD